MNKLFIGLLIVSMSFVACGTMQVKYVKEDPAFKEIMSAKKVAITIKNINYGALSAGILLKVGKQDFYNPTQVSGLGNLFEIYKQGADAVKPYISEEKLEDIILNSWSELLKPQVSYTDGLVDVKNLFNIKQLTTKGEGDQEMSLVPYAVELVKKDKYTSYDASAQGVDYIIEVDAKIFAHTGLVSNEKSKSSGDEEIKLSAGDFALNTDMSMDFKIIDSKTNKVVYDTATDKLAFVSAGNGLKGLHHQKIGTGNSAFELENILSSKEIEKAFKNAFKFDAFKFLQIFRPYTTVSF